MCRSNFCIIFCDFFFKEGNGSDYLVSVTTKADAPVGKYTNIVFFVTRTNDKTFLSYEYDYPFPLYVLFNPYNPNDLAYNPDQDGLQVSKRDLNNQSPNTLLSPNSKFSSVNSFLFQVKKT